MKSSQNYEPIAIDHYSIKYHPKSIMYENAIQ